MKIWLLDEGTPGHTAQTKGIGQMLVDGLGAESTWIGCKLRLAGWERAFTRLRVGRQTQGSAMALAARLYPGLELPSGGNPDLIVSSCGKSAYLNRLLKVATGAKSIFIGERKPFPAGWFDLIVTPVKEGRESEILMPVIEAGHSPESGAAAAKEYWHGKVPESCWAILIGGSSRSHRFVGADWMRVAGGMNALGERYGIRWLLSTSRRTGYEAEGILRKNIDARFLEESVWYGEAPRKCVAAFIGAGERILVTQDSLTMMSEGLLVNKRVELLTPDDWEMPEDSFNGKYVRRLIGEDLVDRLPIVDMPDFSPRGDGRVEVGSLRETFSSKLCEWVKSNVRVE